MSNNYFGFSWAHQHQFAWSVNLIPLSGKQRQNFKIVTQNVSNNKFGFSWAQKCHYIRSQLNDHFQNAIIAIFQNCYPSHEDLPTLIKSQKVAEEKKKQTKKNLKLRFLKADTLYQP